MRFECPAPFCFYPTWSIYYFEVVCVCAVSSSPPDKNVRSGSTSEKLNWTWHTYRHHSVNILNPSCEYSFCSLLLRWPQKKSVEDFVARCTGERAREVATFKQYNTHTRPGVYNLREYSALWRVCWTCLSWRRKEREKRTGGHEHKSITTSIKSLTVHHQPS
jgi:hypothetical protein